MTDLPSGPLKELDSKFEEIALETGAFTYSVGSMSAADRFLLCIANDVCRGHLGLAYRMHVSAACDEGVNISAIKAVIRFVAPYAGYPASADALAKLHDLAAETSVSGEDRPHGDRPDVTNTPSAAVRRPVAEGTDSTDDWIGHFINDRAGRAWDEPELAVELRAALLLVTDVARCSLTNGFRAHVRLAQAVGLDDGHIRDVLRFTAEFGCSAADSALACLESIDSDHDSDQ